jgi:hypothetical protein
VKFVSWWKKPLSGQKNAEVSHCKDTDQTLRL